MKKEAVGKDPEVLPHYKSRQKGIKRENQKKWKEYSQAVLDVMGGVCFG